MRLCVCVKFPDIYESHYFIMNMLNYCHYKTYIQPHIDYCNIIWGGTSQMNLNKFFCLQKRACKIILDNNVDDVMESMQDLKILTVFDK